MFLSAFKESYHLLIHQVLLKKKTSDKLSAKFESAPYQIFEKKGNSVVKQSPEKVQYKRNVTEVKKFTPKEEQSANSDDGSIFFVMGKRQMEKLTAQLKPVVAKKEIF